jgi:hypothetical protein
MKSQDRVRWSVANRSYKELVPARAEEHREVRSAAGSHAACRGIGEVTVEAQVGWKGAGVDEFTPQPLVEDVVQIDRHPSVFDSNPPTVCCLHECVESRTVACDIRKGPASRGTYSNEHGKKSTFASTAAPQQIGIGQTFDNGHTHNARWLESGFELTNFSVKPQETILFKVPPSRRPRLYVGRLSRPSEPRGDRVDEGELGRWG